MILLFALACQGLGGPADIEVECAAACPDGTRRSSFEAVASGEGFVVAEATCETICEPVVACLAPQIPTVVSGAGGNDWECANLDGLSGIPQDAEVDFSFMTRWNR